MSFATRYLDDPTEPSLASAMRDFGRRALLPSVGLAALNVGVGLVIKHPLAGFKAEQHANRWFQARRTPRLDALTRSTSFLGGVSGNIGQAIAYTAGLAWLTRTWWVAALPAIALILEAWMHPLVAWLIDRDRPEVPQLDKPQPTSSFPSGHVGATVAQMVILALMAHRVPRAWWQWIIQAMCVAFPVALVYSRLYLGMHHVTDVAVGALNGVVCGLLAWNYLRRVPATGKAGRRG